MDAVKLAPEAVIAEAAAAASRAKQPIPATVSAAGIIEKVFRMRAGPSVEGLPRQSNQPG